MTVFILGVFATESRADERFGADAFAYELLGKLAVQLANTESLSVDCRTIVETEARDTPIVRQDIRQRLLLRRPASFAVRRLDGSSPAPEAFFESRQANLVIPGAGIVSRNVRDLQRFLRSPTFGFDRRTEQHPFLDQNMAAALVRELAVPQDDETWDQDLVDVEISSISKQDEKQVFVIDLIYRIKDEDHTMSLTLLGQESPILVRCESKAKSEDGGTVLAVGEFSNWNLAPSFAKGDFSPNSKELPTVKDIPKAYQAAARHIHSDRETRANLIGTRLPNLDVTLTNGQTMKLREFQSGRPMVIDFWASWCEPCVESISRWNSLLKKEGLSEIARLSINQGESLESVKEFISRNEWKNQFAVDPARQVGSRLRVNALPQTLIVGANGRIQNVLFEGIKRRTQRIEEELAALLAPEQPIESIDELREREKQVQRTARKVSPAVVGVMLPNGGGSGVIVSPDGLVLTAAHVTGGANRKVQILLQNGDQFEATTLGAFFGRDAAMLKIETDERLPFVEVADEVPNLGEWVISIGHPGGFSFQRAAPVRLGRIVKEPDVRGVARGFLATDGLITQGDSGGPVFDLEGRVIGIHSFIASRMEENMHVPIDVFKTNWERMLKGDVWGGGRSRPSRRATIGIRLENVEGQGVVIAEVTKDSPAERAGLKVNDVVVRFGERNEIESLREFQREFGRFSVGDEIKITVRRGEKNVELTIKLAAG